MCSIVGLPAGLHQALIDRASQSPFVVHFRGLLPAYLATYTPAASLFMLCGLVTDLWQDQAQPLP